MDKLSFKKIPESALYYYNWVNYRQRNLCFILIFLVGVPSLVAAIVLNREILLSFIFFSMIVIIFGNYAIYWPCPRCSNPFLIDFGRTIKPLSQNCVHCGLPKWSPDDKKL